MAIQAYSYMLTHSNATFTGKEEVVISGGVGLLGGNIYETGKLWGVGVLTLLGVAWRYLTDYHTMVE